MNKPQAISTRAAALFARIRNTATYQVEGLKVELAEQIYQVMQEQNISNAELARRLNTSRAYITKILQGDVNFTLETLGGIAHALNCEFNVELKPKVVKPKWGEAFIQRSNVLLFRPEKYRAVRTPAISGRTSDESVAATA